MMLYKDYTTGEVQANLPPHVGEVRDHVPSCVQVTLTIVVDLESPVM